MEEAAASSQKMTYHQDADEQVAKFKVRWTDVHETIKEWVARMTTLVECWNKLDGNVGELSSWVNTQVQPPNLFMFMFMFNISKIEIILRDHNAM